MHVPVSLASATLPPTPRRAPTASTAAATGSPTSIRGRVRASTLALLALNLLALALAVDTHAMAQRAPAQVAAPPVTIVTIVKANGQRQRIASDDERYMGTTPVIPGVQFGGDLRVCFGRRGPSREMRMMENTLELSFLAQHLSLQSERALTANQARKLKLIPDCPEYRPLLHAVATVLKEPGARYQGFEVLRSN
jgi:hypothetical protein